MSEAQRLETALAKLADAQRAQVSQCAAAMQALLSELPCPHSVALATELVSLHLQESIRY